MSTENRRAYEPTSAPVDIDSEASLERWMVDRFAKNLGIAASEIDVERSFSWFGIDSVVALELLEELEQMLDCVISPVTFYEQRNIRALARFLAERQKSTRARSPDSERNAVAPPPSVGASPR